MSEVVGRTFYDWTNGHLNNVETLKIGRLLGLLSFFGVTLILRSRDDLWMLFAFSKCQMGKMLAFYYIAIAYNTHHFVTDYM